MGMACADTLNSARVDHPTFTKVLRSWPWAFPPLRLRMKRRVVIITFGWQLVGELPHKDPPHPWWPDGEVLPRGCPGLLPGPHPLLCCRGRGWWPGLMASSHIPTYLKLFVCQIVDTWVGGVQMDGR